MRTHALFAVACALAGAAAAAPPSAAGGDATATPPRPRAVVVTAARVHVGSGESFAPGEILVEDGVVRSVGQKVEAPEGSERWEHPGAEITPWLVDPHVAVPLERGEPGRPDAALLTTADARPFEGPWLAELRRRGIAAVGLVPSGGVGLQGRSVTIGTDARPASAAPAWKDDAALAVRLPETIEGSASRASARQSLGQLLENAETWRKDRKKAEEKATRREGRPRVHRDAVGGPRPASARPAPPPNPAQEILLRAVDKTLPLLVDLDREADALAALGLSRQRGVPIVISGCRDCPRVARELAESQAVVVLDPLHVPAAQENGVTTPADLPGALAAAGVRMAVTGGGGWPEGPLALRAAAARLAGTGAPRAQAVAAMTGLAAEAAGIRDRIVLAAGNEARLLVWTGDPLEPGSRVERAAVPDDFRRQRGGNEAEDAGGVPVAEAP